MQLGLPVFFCRCKFRFWNWGLVLWCVAHNWPELLLKDFLRLRNIYLISPLYLGSSSSFQVEWQFWGVFVLVGALMLNLSTLYSQLSNFGKTCAIFFGKRKQVLLSARTQFICLIGCIKLFENFIIRYFFPLHLITCNSLLPFPSHCSFSLVPPELRLTLRPKNRTGNDFS